MTQLVCMTEYLVNSNEAPYERRREVVEDRPASRVAEVVRRSNESGPSERRALTGSGETRIRLVVRPRVGRSRSRTSG